MSNNLGQSFLLGLKNLMKSNRMGGSLVNSLEETNLYALLKQTLYPEIIYKKNYAIGIFTGTSPVSLSPPDNCKNPVLTAAEVTDVPAVFVADPFLMKEGPTWHMFFEVFHKKSKKGEIAVAQSDDGFTWHYGQIILSEPYHLSYPYVFEWNHEYYMIPESVGAEAIRLYKADDFPTRWSSVKTLIPGNYVDASIFYYNQKWWLFTAQGDEHLFLFFADDFMGPWMPHPQNPIISGNPHIARPGGRVVVLNDRIIRFAQDDRPQYALKVHAFEVTELSPETYKEQLVVDTLLGPSGNGWNARGMHHIDAHRVTENQWIACVDGWSDRVKAFTK